MSTIYNNGILLGIYYKLIMHKKSPRLIKENAKSINSDKKHPKGEKAIINFEFSPKFPSLPKQKRILPVIQSTRSTQINKISSLQTQNSLESEINKEPTLPRGTFISKFERMSLKLDKLLNQVNEKYGPVSNSPWKSLSPEPFNSIDYKSSNSPDNLQMLSDEFRFNWKQNEDKDQCSDDNRTSRRLSFRVRNRLKIRSKLFKNTAKWMEPMKPNVRNA